MHQELSKIDNSTMLWYACVHIRLYGDWWTQIHINTTKYFFKIIRPNCIQTGNKIEQKIRELLIGFPIFIHFAWLKRFLSVCKKEFIFSFCFQLLFVFVVYHWYLESIWFNLQRNFNYNACAQYNSIAFKHDSHFNYHIILA